MKKLILLLVFSSILFVGCEKETSCWECMTIEYYYSIGKTIDQILKENFVVCNMTKQEVEREFEGYTLTHKGSYKVIKETKCEQVK